MKNIFVFVFLILLTSTELIAQRSGLLRRGVVKEGFITLGFGPSYAFADPDCSKELLGPILNQNILQNQDFSVGFRQVLTENFGYHAFVSYDMFTGEDIKNITRNMSFKSTALQLSAVGEFGFNFNIGYNRWETNSIYGFAGLGVIYNTADLNYDRTKGYVGYSYKDVDVKPTIPYGIGYRYVRTREGMTFGFEVISRFIFSDYLDGFAPPSKSSKSNDMLQGFRFTFSKRIIGK